MATETMPKAMDPSTANRGLDLVAVRPLLTARDLASVLNIGERTVWRLASKAKGRAVMFPTPVRIGRQAVRWRWQDVEKYLQELAGK